VNQELEKGNMDIVKYQAADGQEVTLTPETVRRFLVHGKPDMVSNQELVFFMNICKARKLNPLVKDCYLIKYGNEPAAIVVSIDFYRRRARAQSDCTGWKKGVIVLTKDGTPKETFGLVLPGEKVVGGWFEAKPRGWEEPFRVEVNLEAHIKKTSDGRATKFWSQENQASQIMKVAESQGLRTLWPDEFAKLYTQEELITGEEVISQEEKLHAIDAEAMKSDPAPREKVELPAGEKENVKELFDKAVKETGIRYPKKKLQDFVCRCAEHNRMDNEAIMKGALENIQAFMAGFTKWLANADRKHDQDAMPTDEQMKQFDVLCSEKDLFDYNREDFLGFCLKGSEKTKRQMDAVINVFDTLYETYAQLKEEKVS
jgi:phage recombination protein Bet